MVSNRDEKFIKTCFMLAKKGGRNVLPNPLVGCVITDNKDDIISKDFHKKIGEFHAERNAILKTEDKKLKGATLYCNLEPCSHFGKTPPCADLIIEKGIKKVVFSMFDPNEKVNGKGYKKLKEAGIEVITGILEEEAKELNKVFIKNITKNLPYVMLKTATTMDSKIATESYNSKWITDVVSRQYVMKLRNSYQAIMTGSNTVRLDNPSLTARVKNGINPVRIIMDRKGSLDLTLNVFKDDGTRVIVIDNSKKKYPKHIEKIDFIDFQTLMKTLYELNIYSIMVEAGCGLNSALIKAGAVDEVNHFIAPKILGGGIDFINNFNPEKLDEAIILKDLKIKKLKNDILVNYRIDAQTHRRIEE